MDLLAYFRVLRRHWVLILVLTVLGGAIGAASTELQSESAKARTYYKATNTLVLDTPADSSSSQSSGNQSFTSVEQVAILVTTGDVPNAVAKDLGTPENGRQLAEKIVTLTSSVPNTLEITAVDPDGQRAARLADSFAANLIKSMDARVLARYNKTRDDLTNQLTQLQTQANGFLAQLKAFPPPPDFDTIQKQYDATQNQYYTTYGQLQALAAEGAPQSRLSTLESAQPVPISQTEYDSRLSLGASGQNHLRVETSPNGVPAITVSSSTGTDLNDPVSRGLLGAFLGLVVGIALALLRDRLDHRIRTRVEAEQAYGVPVLADVPRFTRAQERSQEVVAVTAPLSRAAEAYRAIRTSLLFQQASVGSVARPPSANGDGDIRWNVNGASGDATDAVFEPEQQGQFVLMVTSASPREGKSNTCANLAAVFAEAGASVLVVNCDFRRPTVHRLFGVEDEPRTVQDTSVPGVKVVTNVLSDPLANPSQVLAAQRQVVATARRRFDVIILDTAPVLTANDAIEIVGSADLVLLVARSDLSTTDNAQRMMEMLTRLEAPIGGVVLVASTEATNEYYYYYQRGRVPSSRRRSRKPVPPATADDAPSMVHVAGEQPER